MTIVKKAAIRILREGALFHGEGGHLGILLGSLMIYRKIAVPMACHSNDWTTHG